MEKQLENALKLLAKITGKTVKEIKTFVEGEESKINDFPIEDEYELGKSDGTKQLKNSILRTLKRAGIELADFTKFDEVLKAIQAKSPAKEEEEEEEGADPKKPKATPDEIAKLEKAHKVEIAKIKAEHQKAIEDLEAAHKGDLAKVSRESLLKDYLKEGGFAIPTDPEQAKKRMKFAKSDIEGTPWVWDEKTGDYVKADEDGTPILEKNKYVTLKDTAYSVFEASHGRAIADPKGGGNIQQPNPGGNSSGKFEFKTFKGSVPKTQKDYFEILNAPTGFTLEEKSEVREYWKAEGKAAAEQQAA